MNHPHRTLLALILAVSPSCCLSAQQTTQTTETEIKQSEEATVDDAWVQALAKAAPHSEKELQSLLPKTLLGLPLVASVPDNLSSVRGTYSNDKKPGLRSKSISLVIVDGAGGAGLEHMISTFNLLKSDVSQTYKESWGKTTSYNGMRVLVKESTTKGSASIPPRKRSEVEFIKDNRFHIMLQGNDMDSTTLLKSAEAIQALSFPKSDQPG